MNQPGCVWINKLSSCRTRSHEASFPWRIWVSVRLKIPRSPWVNASAGEQFLPGGSLGCGYCVHVKRKKRMVPRKTELCKSLTKLAYFCRVESDSAMGEEAKLCKDTQLATEKSCAGISQAFETWLIFSALRAKCLMCLSGCWCLQGDVKPAQKVLFSVLLQCRICTVFWRSPPCSIWAVSDCTWIMLSELK